MRGWCFVLLLVALYWPSAALAEDAASPLTGAVAGLSDPDDAVKAKALDTLLASYQALDGTRLELRRFFPRYDNPRLRLKAILLLSYLEKDLTCSDLIYALDDTLRAEDAGDAFQLQASRMGCFKDWPLAAFPKPIRKTEITARYVRFREDLASTSPLVRADAIKVLTGMALNDRSTTDAAYDVPEKQIEHLLRERLYDDVPYVVGTALTSLRNLGAPLVVCEEVQPLTARMKNAPATLIESRKRQDALADAEANCAKVVPERRHGGP